MFRIARDHMETLIKRHLDNMVGAGETLPIPIEILTNYLAETLLSMISLWIEEDLPYSAEELDAMFLALTQPMPFALFLALGPVSIPLANAGMPGCYLLVDPTTLLATFGGTTSPGGLGRANLPLPDEPLFSGDLFFQAVYLDAGANPAGLSATAGLKVQVR